MPFIDLGEDFEDVKEADIAPIGTYDLKCRAAEDMTPDGKSSYRVIIDIQTDEPDVDYAPIFHYLGMPGPDDPKKDEEKGHETGTTRRTKLLMIKRFCYAFDVPMSANGFNADDIFGATARLSLDQDEYEGRRKNVIRLPNLPEEG